MSDLDNRLMTDRLHSQMLVNVIVAPFESLQMLALCDMVRVRDSNCSAVACRSRVLLFGLPSATAPPH